ncbi:hypothetical protein [Azohydromonas caseinilytica]|uniref:Uncharacterized protein n=1 Tax=Azohydromonas caseinilytica TaxID=2728836 RepID=A0A848FGE3_9BURK|nr:hypothetical protein [Azohydromonas caseinilytica]NML16941.1 hypothetical protein [Azohydromonas caseinilytica]
MARRPLVITAVLAAFSLGACAQLKPDEHAAHHPEGASAPAASAPAAAPAVGGTGQAGPVDSTSQMARMEQHMKAMREMHEKMARASTPKEREALMPEHMKLMQEGMAMMSSMRPGAGMGGMGMMGGATTPADPAARMQMMEKRMDMMQSMMEMMMDRMPVTPSASKP